MLQAKPEFLLIFILVIGFFILLWNRRLPTMDSVKDLANVLNSRGGNILTLLILSMWFFTLGMRFFYFALSLLVEKKLSPDNAILLMGLSFVTGTAFGGAFGALLKTMTGEALAPNNTSNRVTVESTTTGDENVQSK